MPGPHERAGLRVGLTGGLGSGKSTVAAIFASLGVHTISADEIGRKLMLPGQSVYRDIREKFGSTVVREDGTLDRKALAELAFAHGRVKELNRIVHPAVIAAQEEWAANIFAREPGAIAMVESALIFEVDRDAQQEGQGSATKTDWKQRFDKIVLVVAPEQQKVARYMARVSPLGWDEAVAADAEARLAAQIPDNEKIGRSDYVIQNTGTLEETTAQVRAIARNLRHLGGHEASTNLHL